MARRSSPTTSCDLLPIHPSIAHVFSDLSCHRVCVHTLFPSILLFVSMSYRIVYRGYYYVSYASIRMILRKMGRTQKLPDR